jgi:LysM repeat protein
MTTTTALLTNKAYGYPTRGARRRKKPTILACLHQTANAKAMAIQERNYANRAGSSGPSATAYIDRDGTIVRAIDPTKYAAWSQGDVAHPNTKIPTIAAAVVSGVNMNEWVHESIECSGAGTEPFTDAQFESVARLVVAAHKATGLPINRSTVVVHADLNSVSRRSDPWPPATREARVKRVIARANAILRPPITTVTVKAGDTLSEIAESHKLTFKTLLAFPENAKYRANPGLIHPGRHRLGEVMGGAMDTDPGTIFGREPAMVLALVQAVIALVVAFGLNLAPDQIGAILAVTAVILGLITRSRVSPAS